MVGLSRILRLGVMADPPKAVAPSNHQSMFCLKLHSCAGKVIVQYSSCYLIGANKAFSYLCSFLKSATDLINIYWSSCSNSPSCKEGISSSSSFLKNGRYIPLFERENPVHGTYVQNAQLLISMAFSLSFSSLLS